MKIITLSTDYHSLGFTYSYDPIVVEFCRMLKNSWGFQQFNFDSTNKAWVFSSPTICEAIVAKFPQVEVSAQARAYLDKTAIELLEEQGRMNELQNLKEAKDSSIEIPGFKGTLYPYQKVGVEFIVKSGGRCILGDDPGLGKTAMTIASILTLKPGKVLIVCPATLKYTWKSEVEKWSDLTCAVLDGKSDLSKIMDTDVIVVNYDLLKKFYSGLSKIPFGFMGLDESHLLKSGTTIRTKCVRALAKNIPYVVMLSATQVLNRPVELFSPLNILDPKTWNDWHAFTIRYCGARRTRFGLDVSGATNIEELQRRLSRQFMRRKKEEVLPDLPAKVRVEVPVDLDAKSQEDYSKAFNNFMRFLRENRGKTDPEIMRVMQAEKLVRLNTLREVAVLGKVSPAIEIIENIISSGAKINVFSSFNAPLKELSTYFGSKAVMITGETSNEDRFEIVKKFQNDPEVQVFLGGFMSAGVGITLTAASNVLFLDRAWTPSAMVQAEDRAHRIGSTFESITIYSMHANGTVDEQMKKMLTKKIEVIEGLTGEWNDMTYVQMVMSEIEGLALSTLKEN